jgi:uncharacterized protein (DUF362 family)
MSLVSFVKIKQGNLEKAIEDSLSLINYQFLRDLGNIVIKPNMCYYWDYSTGQTTDPKFVGALINVIRRFSYNANISVVEADASAMKCKHAFKFLGYEKLCQEHNVNLVNLSEEKSDPVNVTVEGQSFRMLVPRLIQNADLKINVTKIKYSLDKIKITCALKNIFGCNPYPKKFRYHPRLNEAIVAANKAMHFGLCLVDGNIVFGSQTQRLGLAMASKDSVAIDVAAAKIAGVNPSSIGYLRIAQKEGLGNMSFVPKGAPIDYFRIRFPKKGARATLMSKAYSLVSLMKLGKRLGLE